MRLTVLIEVIVIVLLGPQLAREVGGEDEAEVALLLRGGLR